ncbi:protein of unknown function [Denitratisoma oestradiolicum]|uniref:Uncharacterized protein n=1 Tax=Denitratisoma oestradiolicum TaxID=311182 RepID=A0A6S6XT86_9PROT|nr:protein of unknown function [Denitratisoma oestradiolicum]
MTARQNCLLHFTNAQFATPGKPLPHIRKGGFNPTALDYFTRVRGASFHRRITDESHSQLSNPRSLGNAGQFRFRIDPHLLSGHQLLRLGHRSSRSEQCPDPGHHHPDHGDHLQCCHLPHDHDRWSTPHRVYPAHQYGGRRWAGVQCVGQLWFFFPGG